MGLERSCLYECSVMHHRLEPVEHRFSYRYFVFGLDLDEIPALNRRLRWFSRERFNLYSFYEKDHVLDDGATLRASVENYLRQNGVAESPARIELVTQLRCFGYVFNPVSFYYTFDASDRPMGAIAEVGNTFGEKKRYFLRREELGGEGFSGRRVKNFYVSPFADLEDVFDFRLGIPDERFTVRIDDYHGRAGDRPFLRTVMGARRLPLSDRQLVQWFFRFPLITAKIIAAIHWQALRLHLKGLPHRRKNEDRHLQTEVFHARH